MGNVVAERYADGFGQGKKLLGWSIAKRFINVWVETVHAPSLQILQFCAYSS